MELERSVGRAGSKKRLGSRRGTRWWPPGIVGVKLWQGVAPQRKGGTDRSWQSNIN